MQQHRGAAAGRMVAVANQKGGVAKTTTVISLGAALVERGRRVLLVDLDAQSCLTFSLGVDPDQVELSVADALEGRADPAAAVLETGSGADLLPASIDLAGIEQVLLGVPDRDRILGRALAGIRTGYDVVLLDCSPSLGLLTLNALAASNEVIIPLQAEMLSHRGVGQLLDTVADVQRLLNPELVVRGLLPTMVDLRSTHARAVLADLGSRYGVPVLAAIPRSIRFAEAPGIGGSVLRTAGRSAGAQAYRQVADGLLAAWDPPRRRSGGSRSRTQTDGSAQPAGEAAEPAGGRRRSPRPISNPVAG